MKPESKAIIFGRYNERYHPLVPLHLKPLSSISDEDAKLFGFIGQKHFNVRALFIHEVDALRQLGYATEQTVIEYGKVVTYSVDELVDLGIYKLI